MIDKIILNVEKIMRIFFLGSIVGMTIILLAALFSGLPKEFFILGFNGLIISIVGFVINHLALEKNRTNDNRI